MSFKVRDLPQVKEGTRALGIEELKDVIRFAASFGSAYGEVVEDGLDWMDVFDFIDPLTKLPDAFTGIENIKEEILDIDQQEAQELVDMVISDFDIPQESAEEYIEDAVELALKIWMFILKHHIPDQEEE